MRTELLLKFGTIYLFGMNLLNLIHHKHTIQLLRHTRLESKRDWLFLSKSIFKHFLDNCWLAVKFTAHVSAIVFFLCSLACALARLYWDKRYVANLRKKKICESDFHLFKFREFDIQDVVYFKKIPAPLFFYLIVFISLGKMIGP